jgi:hypothetical protein
MDRMEQRQDNIETEVRTLAATVSRVEQNQMHATELAKLRFDALDNALRPFADFMKRIEGMLSGEVETQQQREGRALVADYQTWRDGVDADLTRLRLLGRIAVIVIGGNVLAIAAAVYAVVKT